MPAPTDRRPPTLWRALGLALLLGVPSRVDAQTFTEQAFSVKRHWTAASLGLPSKPGGMLFSASGTELYVISPPKLNAPQQDSHGLYRVSVTRGGPSNEVTNLVGPATLVFAGNINTPGLDASIEIGPAGTLFYTYFGEDTSTGDFLNRIMERPGGVAGSSESGFSPTGVTTTEGLVFSPHRTDPATSFGRLQISSGFTRFVYEVPLTPQGGGLFQPGMVVSFARVAESGVAGLQYIPSGTFQGDLMYTTRDSGRVHIVMIDPATGLAIDSTTGQPMLGTQNAADRVFANFSGPAGGGALGLEFDPFATTKDLFVSTYDGTPADSIVQVGGFDVTLSCGDVNGDHMVDVGDAEVVAQWDVELRQCDAAPFSHPELCDVNHDGVCDIGDAQRLVQCDVQLISCAFNCLPFHCQ